MLAFVVGGDAPAALQAIATKASSARIDERYPTVDALAADLMRFRHHEPVAAYAEPLMERMLRFYRRYELPIVLLVAYIVMRFALLIWHGV